MNDILKYMSNRPAHLPRTAYVYVIDAMDAKGFTKTDVAGIMGMTKSSLSYHLGKIKKNALRINAKFLNLLIIILDIKLSDL